MIRVVVTGLGIVSSIGNNADEVRCSLREARSGISFSEDYRDMGFRSQVHGKPGMDLDQAVDRRLRRFMGDGAGYNYIDKAAAYDEFETLFADKPELVESVTPDVMPPSYRIVPTDRSAANVNELANQFAAQPGVREVATATEAIRQIDDFSTRVSQALLIAALVLVGVSALLILNTVFTAIGARKQEIEVMKLVGASNWFIRIPFMLEGTIHGLIGAAMAIPVLFVVDNEVMAFFQESDAVPLFRGFAVPEGFVWDTSIWLLILGGAVGMIGSAVAVTRYLDV